MSAPSHNPLSQEPPIFREMEEQLGDIKALLANTQSLVQTASTDLAISVLTEVSSKLDSVKKAYDGARSSYLAAIRPVLTAHPPSQSASQRDLSAQYQQETAVQEETDERPNKRKRTDLANPATEDTSMLDVPTTPDDPDRSLLEASPIDVDSSAADTPSGTTNANSVPLAEFTAVLPDDFDDDTTKPVEVVEYAMSMMDAEPELSPEETEVLTQRLQSSFGSKKLSELIEALDNAATFQKNECFFAMVGKKGPWGDRKHLKRNCKACNPNN